MAGGSCGGCFGCLITTRKLELMHVGAGDVTEEASGLPISPIDSDTPASSHL